MVVVLVVGDDVVVVLVVGDDVVGLVISTSEIPSVTAGIGLLVWPTSALLVPKI